MKEISVQAMLNVIRDPDMAERPFLIKFVRSRGSKAGPKGSIKTVAKAGYGKPASPDRKKQKKSFTARKKGLHTEKGTLPIYDLETGRYLSPLISHIIQFNQYKVIH
jgi:hypothetical protein